MKKYLLRVFYSASILLNVVLLGEANQTFSARNYQWKRNGYWHICPVIDYLFFFGQKDHCAKSWVLWDMRKRAISNAKSML